MIRYSLLCWQPVFVLGGIIILPVRKHICFLFRLALTRCAQMVSLRTLRSHSSLVAIVAFIVALISRPADSYPSRVHRVDSPAFTLLLSIRAMRAFRADELSVVIYAAVMDFCMSFCILAYRKMVASITFYLRHSRRAHIYHPICSFLGILLFGITNPFSDLPIFSPLPVAFTFSRFPIDVNYANFPERSHL